MYGIGQKLSVREKIGYSLGDLAANLVFQTLVTYLAYFYTDIYGLDTKHASAVILIVGLVAAFGFNPLIGALADRTRGGRLIILFVNLMVSGIYFITIPA